MIAPSRETRAFALAHLVLLGIVLVGFARTFYLHGLFFTKPLPVRLMTHGVALTSWFVVVALQGFLMQVGQRAWHRRVAWLSALVVLGVVVTGLHVTTSLAMTLTSAADPENMFIWLNYVTLPVFVFMVAAAVRWRRQPPVHRRLILFASILVTAPAIARIAFWPIFGRGISAAPAFALVGMLLLAAAAVVYDLRTLKRVHGATWCGLVGILLPWVIGIAMGATGAGFALMHGA